MVARFVESVAFVLPSLVWTEKDAYHVVAASLRAKRGWSVRGVRRRRFAVAEGFFKVSLRIELTGTLIVDAI